MIFKKLYFFVILFLVFFIFIQNKDLIRLNSYSLAIISKLFNNREIISTDLNDQNDSCKYDWLYFVYNHQNFSNFKNNQETYELIACSPLHASMISVIYPTSLNLASYALQIYPNQEKILYWMYHSSGLDNSLKKEILWELNALNPMDAQILKLLGHAYWENKEKYEAIVLYLRACEMNDRQSNGCYYVGTSYQALGDYDKAIYFFRKSYWPPSWEKADKLEEELSSQNP